MSVQECHITRHAQARAKKRLGLTSEVKALGKLAWEQGLTAEQCTGALRRYLIRKTAHAGTTMKAYDGSVFLFSPVGTLITVWLIPAHVRRADKVRV